MTLRINAYLNFFLLCLFFGTKCEPLNFDAEAPKVALQLGSVEGKWKTSIDGRKYAEFEGIPYAKPPVGHLRFKEPQPVEPWSGTWPAIRPYKCVQTHLLPDLPVTGDEDCLYLNVYVPETPNNALLDVLVNIHGGAFMVGYPNEYVNPQYLMDRDWIVVGINYRLGALGFLSTEDDVVPGNNGLKDQILALQWIQKNIKSFGGNPNSVTITGFSAGAGSVHLHYFSPLSKGLFHKGMSVSGSALNPWAIADNPLKKAKKLAKALGCQTDDNKSMIECLKQRSATLIVNVTASVLHEYPPAPHCPFAPVVEKKGTTGAYLTEHPYKMLKEGRVKDLPWIVSNTPDEGLLYIPYVDKMNEIKDDFSLFKYMVDFHETIPESQEAKILSKIQQHYYPNGVFDPARFDILVKAATDRMMSVYTEQAAELQSKVTKSPVYYYKFSYEGANSFKNLISSDYYKGVCHGDDMPFFFGGIITKPLTREETKLKNICHDMLYSYVKNGSPSVDGIKWKPISDEFVYLNFASPNEIKLETKNEFPDRDFWIGLGLLENEYFYSKKDEL